MRPLPRKTSKLAATRPAAGRRPANPASRRGPLPRRKDRPWGWITTIVVVLIAGAALFGYAATRPGATAIAGVRSYPSLPRNHVTGTVHYPQTPPAGATTTPHR